MLKFFNINGFKENSPQVIIPFENINLIKIKPNSITFYMKNNEVFLFNEDDKDYTGFRIFFKEDFDNYLEWLSKDIEEN